MFNVDIVNKANGKVIATTTVRGGDIDTLEKAVEHVTKTHPKHTIKASATQPPETQAAIDAAKAAAANTPAPPQVTPAPK